MSQLPDSLLLAFVRGELTAGENKLLSDAARVTPELRDRIAAMRQSEVSRLSDTEGAPTDCRSRTARPRDGDVLFISAHPVPNAATAAAAARMSGHTRTSNVGVKTSIRQSRIARFGGGNWSQAAMLLLALGIGLVGGLVGGLALDTTPENPTINTIHADDHVLGLFDGQIVAENGLANFLETSLTGQQQALSANVGAEGTAVATLTFRDHTGRFCREYELNLANQHMAGIACRGDGKADAGKWRVTAQVTLDDMISTSGSASGNAPAVAFRPASSGTIEIIESLSARMQSGPALPADREVALIGNGWTLN